jgi:FAD/FMN-containing dehydrogenase
LLGVDELPRLFDFTYAVQRVKLGEECFILDRVAAAMLLARADAERFAVLRQTLPAWLLLQNVAGFERLPAERLAYQTDDIMRHAAAAALQPSETLGDLSAHELLAAARNDASPSDWRRDLRGHCLSLTFQCTLDRSAPLIEIARTTGRALGLADEDVGIYLQPIVQNRFCEVELLMPYAADDEAAVARLQTFERESFAALAAAGAFFARPYGHAERAVFAHNPTNTDFLRRLKRIFDPANILTPGKFGLLPC